MEQQWVVKSLAVWGLIITTLTAILPAINQLLAIKGWSFDVDLTGLGEAGKSVIMGVGTIVGVVLIIVDRVTGQAKKSLTLRPPE